MPPYRVGEPVVLTFIVIPTALAAILVWGVIVAWRRSGASPAAARRAGVITALSTGAWMALTWIAGGGGILRAWDRVPPPFALLLASIIIVSCALAFGPAGRRLAAFAPLWALVAVQGFRLPLELAMHALAERGIMSPQMTYRVATSTSSPARPRSSSRPSSPPAVADGGSCSRGTCSGSRC